MGVEFCAAAVETTRHDAVDAAGSLPRRTSPSVSPRPLAGCRCTTASLGQPGRARGHRVFIPSVRGRSNVRVFCGRQTLCRAPGASRGTFVSAIFAIARTYRKRKKPWCCLPGCRCGGRSLGRIWLWKPAAAVSAHTRRRRRRWSRRRRYNSTCPQVKHEERGMGARTRGKPWRASRTAMTTEAQGGSSVPHPGAVRGALPEHPRPCRRLFCVRTALWRWSSHVMTLTHLKRTVQPFWSIHSRAAIWFWNGPSFPRRNPLFIGSRPHGMSHSDSH